MGFAIFIFMVYVINMNWLQVVVLARYNTVLEPPGRGMSGEPGGWGRASVLGHGYELRKPGACYGISSTGREAT